MPTQEKNFKIQRSYSKFNRERNIKKAASLLKGIMKGLVVDKILNEQEVLFLDLWIKSHYLLSKDDSDINLLIDSVKNVVKEQVLSQAKIDELSEIINAILQANHHIDHNGEESLNVLQGIIQGILADGVLTDNEINGLDAWLKKHTELNIVWPASELVEQMKRIYADGFIDENERKNLITTLSKITTSLFDDTDCALPSLPSSK